MKRLKNLRHKISNIGVVKNVADTIEFQKQIMANQHKVKDFILKINILTNTLSAYIEKHKQEENEELLNILKQLITIQEIFMIKEKEKIIKGETK